MKRKILAMVIVSSIKIKLIYFIMVMVVEKLVSVMRS